MRESPAVKLIELLRNAGADVAYHDPHVPSFAEHGIDARVAARARRRTTASSIVDRPLGDRLRDARRRRAARRRLPQRDRRERQRRRQGLEAVSVRVGQAGPRRLGQEPRRGTSTSSPTSRGSATPTRSGAPSSRARYPQRARRPATSTSCSRRPELDAVVIATPVPTHYALAKQALEAGQARVRREAAGDARRGDGGARRARRGARPRAHARATCSSTTRACAS